MTMDNQKRIRRCSGILQTISKYCLFFLYFFSFVRFTTHAFSKIYSTCLEHCSISTRGSVSFQHRHWCIWMKALVYFNQGTGAFQCRHWCISTQALVHLNEGTGIFQKRHGCISMQAVLHFDAGIGAFQCRHWCIQRKHWCISTQALVHFNAGISAFQWRHWCISMQALAHFNKSTGAFQRGQWQLGALVRWIGVLARFDWVLISPFFISALSKMALSITILEQWFRCIKLFKNIRRFLSLFPPTKWNYELKRGKVSVRTNKWNYNIYQVLSQTLPQPSAPMNANEERPTNNHNFNNREQRNGHRGKYS